MLSSFFYLFIYKLWALWTKLIEHEKNIYETYKIAFNFLEIDLNCASIELNDELIKLIWHI